MFIVFIRTGVWRSVCIQGCFVLEVSVCLSVWVAGSFSARQSAFPFVSLHTISHGVYFPGVLNIYFFPVRKVTFTSYFYNVAFETTEVSEVMLTVHGQAVHEISVLLFNFKRSNKRPVGV